MREEEEKEVGVASSSMGETNAEIEDVERRTISSESTDSSSLVEVESINRTFSRNAGLVEDSDKDLSRIASVATTMTSDPRFEVDFEEGENPQDWSMVTKGFVIGFMSFSTLVVVMCMFPCPLPLLHALYPSDQESDDYPRL